MSVPPDGAGGCTPPGVAALQEALRHRPGGLDLLVLFGSRAREESVSTSDWDLAYLATADLDADGLLAVIVTQVGADRVDLVDLARASAQLRYRVATDAVVVFERRRDVFATFWMDAVSYWLDMAPVIRAEYDAALARTGR